MDTQYGGVAVPIPMGYRDQNHAAQGPYQLSGVMQNKWDSLTGCRVTCWQSRQRKSPRQLRRSPSSSREGISVGIYVNNGTLHYDDAPAVASQVFYLHTGNWKTNPPSRMLAVLLGSSQCDLCGKRSRAIDSRTYWLCPVARFGY